jgi:drug/metabolite transporter (DMT)-like permease
MMGVAIALVGATAFSFMSVLIRLGVQPGDRDNGLRATLIVNVAVFSFLLVATFMAGGRIRLSAIGIGAFVMAGLCATFFGRYALFAAIGHIGAARATAIKNATPLVSVGLAIAFLGEVLSLLAALGIVLVMLGIGLLVREVLMQHADATAPDGLDQITSTTGARPAEVGQITSSGRRGLLLGVAMAGAAAIAFGSGHAFRQVGIDALSDSLLGATIGSWVALIISLGLSGARHELGGFVGVVGSFRPAVWLAGAAGAVGQLCFFSALAVAPLSHVAVVAASETVITVMLAARVMRHAERVTARLILPAVLVFGGSAIIAVAP